METQQAAVEITVEVPHPPMKEQMAELAAITQAAADELIELLVRIAARVVQEAA